MSKEYISKETIDYLILHFQKNKNFSLFPTSKRREYEEQLLKQINHLEKSDKLRERNKLVRINREMVKGLPFDFEIDEPVLVKINRPIKAVIKEMDSDTRMVFVKPIDSNLYKESFYCSEKCIVPMKNRIEEVQMKLF